MSPSATAPEPGCLLRRWSSSSARPASAPRSPRRACSRPTSAPRRSSGRTRSASSSSPSRSATGSAAARRPPPAHARPLPAGPRRRGADRRCPLRGAALPRLLGRRLRQRLGRRLRRLAVRRPGPGRRAGHPARRRRARGRSGSRSPTSSTPARWSGGSTRSRPPARCVGTMLAALLLIPLLGTQRTFLVFALALAAGRRGRARLALRRRRRSPLALAICAAGRDDQGRRHRPRPLRGGDRPPVRARGRTARRRSRCWS